MCCFLFVNLGVYRRSDNIKIFIDTKSIHELHAMTADASALTIGANVSLTELMETLQIAPTKCNKYTYATEFSKHLDLVASVPVRNVKSAFFFGLQFSNIPCIIFLSGWNNCWQFEYQTFAQ